MVAQRLIETRRKISGGENRMTPGMAIDGGRAWFITFLLFLAQIINYFDKSVMGLAAPSIMKDLGLTAQQYGLVASSFFLLYPVAGVVVGLFVVQRIRSKTLLTILVLIWSLAQLPIAFFSSLAVLVGARIMLGIGEGPGSPSATSAAHEWFSSDRRNMPTAVLMLGSSLGGVAAGPVLAAVMAEHGWRSGFLLCSGLGFAWMLIWIVFGASGPAAAAPKVAVSIAPPRGIWTDRTIIGCIVAGFCSYWSVGFSVAWLAPFIRLGLGYDAQATGWAVSAVSLASSVLLISVSFASQLLLQRGVASRIARAGANGLCLAVSGAAFAGAAVVGDPVAKLFLLAVASALPLLTFTLGPSLISEVVPAAQRGRMLITIYAGITIAGFLSPLAAGQLIGERGLPGYNDALIANAVVALIGASAAFALLRPEQSRRRFATSIPSDGRQA